jgi:RNA methyltransferase, TrmH family
MLRITHLTSRDNPRVKDIVRLRHQRHRRAAGVFVAEGFREVGRALTAGLTLRQLYWSRQITGMDLEALLDRLPQLRPLSPTTFEVIPAVLGKMTYLDEPEGVLAVFDQPTWRLDNLPHPPTGNGLWLFAAGTNKPGNLGAMARTAAAAGATGILAADADVDPFNPNAIRASTGAVFTLPIIQVSADQALAFLRSRQIRILAAAPDAAVPYTAADLTGPIALVIGAEDVGLSAHWLSAAHQRILIPMHAGVVDSLNASIAAAILLFEAMRQRA